jgi:hypothetical protein
MHAQTRHTHARAPSTSPRSSAVGGLIVGRRRGAAAPACRPPPAGQVPWGRCERDVAASAKPSARTAAAAWAAPGPCWLRNFTVAAYRR